MSVIAIIPARFGSTRFPGKPLADRTGKYLIQHVVEGARKCRALDRVIVATDDARIESAVRSFGGEVVMTSTDHPNGTSRLAEVVTRLNLRCDLVLNVQGDEPDIDPAVIERLVATMNHDPAAPMGTIASPFAAGEDPSNPNIVKVVTTCSFSARVSKPGASVPDSSIDMKRQDGGPSAAPLRALYFSRALIPFHRDTPQASSLKPQAFLKHVGIYAYRPEFLLKYVTLPATPLEQAEQLEQLRALEHGHAIAVAVMNVTHHGIDTPEQYDAFVARCAARK